MSRRAWWWYLAILLAGLPVYLLAPRPVQQGMYYVYGLSTVVAILVGLRVHRPVRQWPWLLFAVGLLLFALADVAFDILAIGGHEIPIPSVADNIYLAAYLPLVWAMVLVVRYRMRGADVTSALDGVMIAVGVGVMAWVFIMAPYAHDPTLSLGARFVPIAYPALDLVLVAVVARLLLSRGVHNPSFRLLAASVLALLVADGLFAFGTANDIFADSRLIDIVFLLSYALWGAAALHPSMARVTDPAQSSEVLRTRRTVVVLAFAALTSPVTLVVQQIRGAAADHALLAATSAVMVMLVLARLWLLTKALDSSNRQLAQAAARQATLTETAVAFVSAGDAESVVQAAVRAGVALTGDANAWSAYMTMSASGPTVTAVAGPAPYRVGEAADPRPSGDCHVASVVVDGQMRGKLVVGHLADAAVLPTLELVCAQVSLALQSAQATEERLRARTERRFRSLVQNSAEVLTLMDPDGVLRYQSPGVRAMLGHEPDGLVGQTLDHFIHPDDAPAAWAELTKVLTGGLAAAGNFECRARHADGSWREVDTIITNLLDEPDVGAIVLNSRDVTERRALERELSRQALQDSLTGMANRTLFLDRVAHALHRPDPLGGGIAVLFLDIDDFKMVNDSLGHPAGDELLIAVAHRLKASTRPGDTVARFGGDEFGLLLESGAMPHAAHAVAERIAEALKMPIRIGTEDVSVRASIGIALGQPEVDGPDGLLRDADLAMYMAKRNGKGRFEMFRPAMHEEAVRRLATAADLRRAIEGGQLEVYYQPIVNIAAGTACGAEALVRWHHPTKGFVSPAEFIPVAESTGLIVPLGRWVLNEACRQAESWRQSGLTDDAFYISVNLSARQLLDPSLLDDVEAAIRDSGLPVRVLVLEVTESALVDDVDTAIARLHALKDLGLRLAVDDFGTGYSSLSYLRNLPVDVVKIDKSFVDRITVDAEGAALVRSVIDLSSALGLTTIAEGVEHEDQRALLSQLGCDNIQGYLFAKPMPNGQFAEAVTKLRSRVPALLRA